MRQRHERPAIGPGEALPCTPPLAIVDSGGAVFRPRGGRCPGERVVCGLLSRRAARLCCYQVRSQAASLPYLEMGRYGKAVTDCTKAIEPDPRLPMAYINRA